VTVAVRLAIEHVRDFSACALPGLVLATAELVPAVPRRRRDSARAP